MTNVLIMHHNDMDGRSGGYILYKYFSAFVPKEDIKTIECGYNGSFNWDKLVNKDTIVAIVDYSLNNQNFQTLTKIVPEKNIIWIDHHKSAIEQYQEQKNLDGLRNINYSGAELAYMYLNGYCQNFDNPDKVKKGNLVTDFEDAYASIPLWVKEVGNFDCWRTNIHMDYSKQFNYGIQLHWDECELNTEDGRNFWAKIDQSNNIDEYVNDGKIIMKYNDAQNAKSVKMNGFECRLRKTEFSDYKAIALNTSSIGSDIFKSVFNDYEIGFVFSYTEKNKENKHMSFSVYRLGMNPQKNIDVSKIAQSFGGGGHTGAAGFKTSGTLPFI